MERGVSCVLLVCVALLVTSSAKKPHILFIVADDLGWNDVGFHNPDMLTPNIDRLATTGVIFNHSYVQPLCSPSRTAFMTGRYPFTAGMQHMVIIQEQDACLPLNFTLLPQVLKSLGYATHAIGKWHLGYCNWNCTPTYRGFDTFFGFYNALDDYYSHTIADFLDYRDNTKVADNYNGTYSAYTFVEKAKEIISMHDQSTPLFLYFPFQNVHAPIEVPKQYEALYPNQKNAGRKTLCGMVSALDEAVGNVTEALSDVGMMEDTLVLFTADNGGALPFYGNNWPLRGGKETLWEGGTRGVAFMHGWGLKKTGYTYSGLIHAVDWMPTLVQAASGVPVMDIDGVSQWDSIVNGLPSKRTEFVYNIDSYPDPYQGHAAIREGKFKLIMGYPGLYDGWYPPQSEVNDAPLMSVIFPPNSTADAPMWLFDLEEDPLETRNLVDSLPDVAMRLKTKLSAYRQREVPANYPPSDPKANPKNYGGVWTPGWC